jgi:hypothetical protein
MSFGKAEALKRNGKSNNSLVDHYHVVEPFLRSPALRVLLMQFILIVPPIGTSDDISVEGGRARYGQSLKSDWFV